MIVIIFLLTIDGLDEVLHFPALVSPYLDYILQGEVLVGNIKVLERAIVLLDNVHIDCVKLSSARAS